MFTLLSGLWKYVFQKDEYFILILGLNNAGKTTFLEQIKRKFCSSYNGIPFEKIGPTVGLNVGKITVSGIKVIFWDLGGQQELRSLWDKYFEECHGVIFMIDCSDEQRLEESHNAFDEALKHEFLKGVPLLVLANKQDIPWRHRIIKKVVDPQNEVRWIRNFFDNEMAPTVGSLTVDKIQSVFHPESAILEDRQCFIQPTSALNGDGIEAGILWMANQVQQNLDRPPRQKDIS